MITDLEAHINTSIITEKSVRKAQDRHLAEEMDAIVKLIKAYNEKWCHNKKTIR